MKTKFFLIFITLIFITAGGLFAQNTQELRIGSFLSGNISAGQEIWFSIRSAQACLLIIETDSPLDTYLELYDAQRNIIAENDDGAGYPNARIYYSAQANTSYLIKLRVLNMEGSGPYMILADSRPITELRVGSSVSGSIIQGQENWYNVRSTQNGYLVVETTGDTDTLLDIYDQNFNLLASDDDGAGYPNARVRIQVAAGNTYLIILKSYSDGAYRVQASNQAFPVPTALSIGSFVNGNLTYGGENWYSVRAAQNGYLTVETTGNVESYLNAYDDSYNYLAYDEGYSYPNARIRMQAVAGRTYYFQLRGYDSSGSYRIFASFQPYPTPTSLSVGSFLNGNIAEGNEIWYSVRTTRSGRLTVETTGAIDTVLDVYTGEYQHIERNDDNDGNLNAKIIIPNVSANTTYLFRLTCYTPGPFRIFAYLD